MATSLYAAPLGNPRFKAFVQATATPLVGGKVGIFMAGTNTPDASYPTYLDAIAGTNANTNPVILDANGEATIFLQVGRLYKIVLQDSASVTYWTVDNVNPAQGFALPNNPLTPGEWALFGTAANGQIAFASAVSFTLIGVDATATFHAGRRVRTSNNGGTIYSTVVSSAFAAGNTTVTVINDSGVIDVGLSQVFYGIESYINPSYLDPRTALEVVKNGNQVGFAVATQVAAWTVQLDALSEWNAGLNRWVAKYPGRYLVILTVEASDTGVTQQVLPRIFKTGADNGGAAWYTPPVANLHITPGGHHVFQLAAGDYIEAFVLGTANTTVYGTNSTALSIVRIP
jgi:hypothetical protein